MTGEPSAAATGAARAYGLPVEHATHVDGVHVVVAEVDTEPCSRSLPRGRDAAPGGRTRLTLPPETPPAHRALLGAIAEELRSRDPSGAAAGAAVDPRALALVLAASTVDTAATWDEQLGGFYDVDGVRHLLAGRAGPLTKQAVSKRRGLLALTTGSGRVVYPIFQFAGSTVVEGLDEVLAALPERLVSRWTLASWLVSAQRDLDGESPVAPLYDRSPAPVLRAAHRWAAALAA